MGEMTTYRVYCEGYLTEYEQWSLQERLANSVQRNNNPEWTTTRLWTADERIFTTQKICVTADICVYRQDDSPSNLFLHYKCDV